MKQAKAYSPSHITGFFKVFENGSTGAGVNLSEGMTTTVKTTKASTNKITVNINGKKENALTSKNVAEKYLAIKKEKFALEIFHKTNCPIGYGLGVSGAGALSLSIALNKALETNFSKKQVLEIAKQAEIEEGTGLGDVIAEQFHGLMVGLPPFPSKKAHIIQSEKKFVVCGFFSPIETKKVIRNQSLVDMINETGDYCMQKMLEKKTTKRFEWLCRVFAVSSGLVTPEVKHAMEEIPGSSQAMLGSTVFTLTNNPKEISELLKKHTNRILVSRIAEKGAHVL